MKNTPDESEPILISALADYVFCPRRCALKQIEGQWGENAHTVTGTLLHERADEPGYETSVGVTLLRALPLVSERYGLTGRADIVEVHADTYIPVEYKKGKRRKFENDEVQLCAQAFCLEEMFACEVAVGYVFHAASKRRREVIFDWRLREETKRVIDAVRQLLREGVTPPAELKPRCDGCSLHGVCMPEVTDPHKRAALDLGLWS